MYGYDGQTFETFEQFLEYLYAKYGNMGAANHASITWWGEDLHGNYLFIDGIQQLGTEGADLADKGLSSASDVLALYDANPVEFSRNTIEQLNQLKQTQETIIEGTIAGILGILVTLILNIPINIIIKNMVGISNISKLPIVGAIALILISIILTFIAGLIPSSIASKKDPVEALRTE